MSIDRISYFYVSKRKKYGLVDVPTDVRVSVMKNLLA